jgi:hypothetical protein
MMRIARIALIAAVLVACHKGDSGPPCEQVVDHMQALMKQMMPGHDEAALGDRKQMIEQCKQRKMPAKTRQCIVDAKSFNDLATCNAGAQKTTTPAPPPLTPVPPAPANATGTGSGSAGSAGSAAPTPPAPSGSASGSN